METGTFDINELVAKGYEYVGLLDFRRAIFVAPNGDVEVWNTERYRYTYSRTIPQEEVKTYEDLCSEEAAVAKCRRERQGKVDLAKVVKMHTPARGSHPYRLVRWGAFKNGNLVATIHCRMDGKLEWSPYPDKWHRV